LCDKFVDPRGGCLPAAKVSLSGRAKKTTVPPTSSATCFDLPAIKI
jgi:hypothetical protein